MRLLAAAALSLALVASPVWADNSNSSNGANASQGSTGRSFGHATCPEKIVCQDGSVATDAATLAASASTCINEYFGYPNNGGFFDESAGVDSNNCLTSKPNILPKGVGSQLTPRCCIPATDANPCHFSCDLIAVGH